MQNQFYQRLTHGQGYFDNYNSDQGTWQTPVQGQEDTHFTGNSTNYFTNQPSEGSGDGSGQIGGEGSELVSPVFSTGMASYNNKNIGGYKGLQNTGLGNQYITDSQQTINNSQFASKQVSIPETSVGKVTLGSQDDSDTGYYGFPNESYMTNSGGNMIGMSSVNSMNIGGTSSSMNIGGFGGSSINMGGFGGSSVNMGGFGSGSMNIGSNLMNVGNNSLNLGGNSLNMGNNNSAMCGSGIGMVNSGNFPLKITGNYGSDNMMTGVNSGANNMGINNGLNNMEMSSGASNRGINNSTNNKSMSNRENSVITGNCGKFGNGQFQNKSSSAVVGIGALATSQESYRNNSRFSNTIGNVGNNKRGKRGAGFGFNNYKSADMFSYDRTIMGKQNHPGGGNNNICLSATNHNQWCFLRKNFNKQDNDLAEHLFDIHEKFCHHCRERIEERKWKRKKISNQHKEIEGPPVEEIPDEELTEEELEIKKLMGFAGFKTTKGVRAKDNNYSTVSSVNISGSSEAVDETTSLTEAEKRMIALRGGFSVFTKPDISRPSFGAPAVTFDSVDGS